MHHVLMVLGAFSLFLCLFSNFLVTIDTWQSWQSKSQNNIVNIFCFCLLIVFFIWHIFVEQLHFFIFPQVDADKKNRKIRGPFFIISTSCPRILGRACIYIKASYIVNNQLLIKEIMYKNQGMSGWKKMHQRGNKSRTKASEGEKRWF